MIKRSCILIVLVIAACATTGPAVDKSKMAEGYYMKGLSYFQEAKYELASVEFHRSIQTDSGYKQSYYMLGIISEYRGQYDAAIDFFEEAADRDSDYSEAYNAMGAVYSRQQKWKEALRAYRKALENKLYKTPHVTWLNIGEVYMAQKDYDSAIDAFRQAKSFVKQDFIQYRLGTALFDSGKTRDAIGEFREGIEISPQNAQLRYSLAVSLLKDGKKKEAIIEFRRAAEMSPASEIGLKSKDYLKTLR